LGEGPPDVPNRLEPRNLCSGITIVGKSAEIPDGVRIGRNCRIDPKVTPSDFPQREVPSGESIVAGRE